MEGRISMVANAEPARSGKALSPLWLIDSLAMGGAESLAVAFARQAGDQGISLRVCTRTTVDGNPLEAELGDAGATLWNLDARALVDRKAFRRFLEILRQERPDVLHAHLTYSSIWAALAARELGLPLVASIHVSPERREWRQRLRLMILVFLLNRWANRVAFVSHSIRREWIRRTRLDPARTVVIPNGVTVRAREADQEGRRRLRAGIGLEPDAFLIVSVAVLREGKGVDILLLAARDLLLADDRLQVIIVGDGPLREHWQSLAVQHGIADRVHWLGFRRDVDDILSRCDLFVLPTLADAFPTVVLEAFAAGVPVIASDVGGIPEIISDTSVGMLVPPGDPDLLAKAIAAAVSDEAWRASTAAAARLRVEEEFSTARWARRLEKLYREVIREGSRARA
ncbi:MAG TPA: glycosyltransferase family 4 protein [Thermoanaerobaculia bacterium]|nr:glycosyltransferase family 4 protein [Thermoanaerobaculia bacterium]